MRRPRLLPRVQFVRVNLFLCFGRRCSHRVSKLALHIAHLNGATTLPETPPLIVLLLVLGDNRQTRERFYTTDTSSKIVSNISPYLTANDNIIVEKRFKTPPGIPPLNMGNQAIDGGFLILNRTEKDSLLSSDPSASRFVRPIYGANDFVQSEPRFCIWVTAPELNIAEAIPELRHRFECVREYRERSGEVARSLAHIPLSFSIYS